MAMSKAKEQFYKRKEFCDKNFGGFVPEIMDYIKELEEQNKEMLNTIICSMINICEECMDAKIKYIKCDFSCAVVEPLKEKIEKETGMDIDKYFDK